MNDLTVVGVDGSTSSKRALDWAADRVATRGGRLDMTTTWLDGRPVHELVRRSATAGLVVLGTDKSPDASGPRVGTLPLTVAAKAECAVAVIPDIGRARRSGVLAGIDRSPQALTALATAIREAGWLGADVTALHAWNVPPVLEDELLPHVHPDPRFEEAQLALVVDAIDQVATSEAVRIVPEVVRQNPAAALIERARNAELLVIGTRGRGRIASSVLGSVSHDVLTNITSPVIVVGDEYEFVAADLLPESEEDW
ncbi:universal stress protein [Leifsonia sp. NPDC058248]|uniref:universal stress protein n=1 Tax=Leifsonia sp. NPDC058248 TaxID=3346402 RepID=UPI0036DA93DA